jgi:hypothetical protein
MTRNTSLNRSVVRQIGCMLSITAIGLVAFAAITPSRAQAQPHRTAIPTELQIPTGNKLILKSRGIGTQNYICLPTSSGFAWTFTGPQATLFDQKGRQVTTHFLSPNPGENDTPRVAWESSRDSSTVWGTASVTVTDPAIVAPGAVPWLLVKITGTQTPNSGTGQFSRATLIQRLNTTGGVIPTTGCGAVGDVGKRSFVPYTADYLFYQPLYQPR